MTLNRRHVEIFSAGCPACDEAIALVRDLADDACDVRVLDMHSAPGAARAHELGVRSLPAVAIDGELACCCAGRGVSKVALREAGLGAG